MCRQISGKYTCGCAVPPKYELCPGTTHVENCDTMELAKQDKNTKCRTCVSNEIKERAQKVAGWYTQAAHPPIPFNQSNSTAQRLLYAAQCHPQPSKKRSIDQVEHESQKQDEQIAKKPKRKRAQPTAEGSGSNAADVTTVSATTEAAAQHAAKPKSKKRSLDSIDNEFDRQSERPAKQRRTSSKFDGRLASVAWMRTYAKTAARRANTDLSVFIEDEVELDIVGPSQQGQDCKWETAAEKEEHREQKEMEKSERQERKKNNDTMKRIRKEKIDMRKQQYRNREEDERFKVQLQEFGPESNIDGRVEEDAIASFNRNRNGALEQQEPTQQHTPPATPKTKKDDDLDSLFGEDEDDDEYYDNLLNQIEHKEADETSSEHWTTHAALTPGYAIWCRAGAELPSNPERAQTCRHCREAGKIDGRVRLSSYFEMFEGGEWSEEE